MKNSLLLFKSNLFGEDKCAAFSTDRASLPSRTVLRSMKQLVKYKLYGDQQLSERHMFSILLPGNFKRCGVVFVYVKASTSTLLPAEFRHSGDASYSIEISADLLLPAESKLPGVVYRPEMSMCSMSLPVKFKLGGVAPGFGKDIVSTLQLVVSKLHGEEKQCDLRCINIC